MPRYYRAIVFPLVGSLIFSLHLAAADPVLPQSDSDLIRDLQERLLQNQQRRLDEL